MAKKSTVRKKSRSRRDAQRHTIDWPKELSKQTKAALVDMLAELAEENREMARRLMQRFDIELPLEALRQATRQAIADATYYSRRDINRNFRWDYGAYDTVRRNLRRLIKAGCFQEAMQLALELMERGSEQVEMSDEGLMSDDIEASLKEVIGGLQSSDLPAETIAAWSRKMLRADRVGFLCEKELRSLAGRS